MPKTLSPLAILLQVAVAAALISESVGVASGCPMSTTSMELFSGDVDWMCSKNFACLTSYCTCVGGSIATVGGMTECVNATAVAADAQNCAAARVSCTVGAALATTMSTDGSMCYSSTQPLRDAYAQFYYDPAHRPTSNLTSSCSADLCNVLSPIASSTAFNFTFICSLVGFPLVPPPSGGGGGGGVGLPHNDACPKASHYYFATAPASCPAVHACDTAYCSCLSLDYTTSGCSFPALNTTAVSKAAFEACANTYVRCLTTAAISMWPGSMYNTSDSCQSWSNWVVYEYATFYHSSSRSTTSFYTECTGLLCDSEYFFYNGSLNYVGVCGGLSSLPAPPIGGGGGGGGGLPHNPMCPNATKKYFSDSPSTCPPVVSCNTAMCTCLGTPMSDGECNVGAINTSAVSEAAFQACANTYLRCVTSAAISMWPGSTYNTSDPCQRWSNWVVNEYATFYYSSSRSTTSFYTECTGLLCDAESYFYNATLDYASVCSGLSSLPTPPIGGGGGGGGGGKNGCVAPPQRYFDNMPITQCPSVKNCLISFCTCAGSSWNATINDCNSFTTPPSLAQAQTCISTGLTCIVNQALLIYVPGAATDNLDPCVAWSVPIAADYAAWHASTTKQTTSLFATCNSTACSMLSDLGASAAQIAATCAYAGLTATPTYVPPNPCAYSCPDASCARTIAGCNCTKQAVLGTVGTAFIPTLGSTFDPSRALSVQAYASYAVANASAPCGTFDFSPYLIFNWKLSNSSSTVVTFNASSFYVAAFALAPGTTYTLTLRTIGLIPSQTNMQSWTFTTTTPVPFVSITQRGSTVDMSTLAAYTFKTLIQDKYPVASPSFAWSCTPGDVSVACPSLTNATVNYLTIAAGANAGSYTITFTYRGVSSSVELTVIAGEIPIVSLISSSVPIVAIPVIVYLPSQTINLFASVKYSGNVTYRWAVASTTVCTTKTCAINASSLTQSTASDLDIATNTPVMNTITLTVTDATVTTKAASSSIKVAVAPTYTLAITVGNQNTPAATSATSLSDRLALTATSSITTPGAPYGGVYQFTFGYGALNLPLLTQPTMSGFSAVAPLVITSAASSTVTFTGKLLVNGLLATRATATFAIAKPSNLTAVTSQLLGDTNSITDPDQAIAAASGLQEILSATADPAQASAIGNAMLNMFVNSMKDFSSQSSDQVGATLAAIKSAAKTLSGSSKTNAAAKLTSLVSLALSAGNFDPSNGQNAIAVLADVSAAQARATVALLALKMAIDATLAVGGTKIISSGGLSVSTYKQSMDSLGGSTMVGNGFSVAMPTGINLGLDADAVAATSGSASDENIFDDGTGATSPVGGVKTMTMVDENGNLIPVANLAEPICIDMGASGSTCKYRDETLNEWVTTGLTSTVDSNGHLICCTSHFTSFGGFQSSAASVMLSLLAVAVVLAIQMVM